MHPCLRVPVVAFALLLASGAARADDVVPVPPLAAPVVDLANTLTPQQAAALDAKLSAFSAARGSQVAVLIVPTTGPEDIEQYSIRVVDAWKLGRKGVDDGVLLLVARDDRRARIEVENQNDIPYLQYFYIDYELYRDELPDSVHTELLRRRLRRVRRLRWNNPRGWCRNRSR